MKNILLLTIVFLILSCQNRYSSINKHAEALLIGKVVRTSCKPIVSLSVSDTLIVEFTQYPGRAYTWYLENLETLPGTLKFIDIKTVTLADLDDAPEKVEYTFLATNKDSLHLNFKYQRPWEKNKPAADSCAIFVIIK